MVETTGQSKGLLIDCEIYIVLVGLCNKVFLVDVCNKWNAIKYTFQVILNP